MHKFLLKSAVAATVLVGTSLPSHAFIVSTITDVTQGVSTTCNTQFGITALNCAVADGWSFSNANFLTFEGTVGGFVIGSNSVGADTTNNLPGTSLLGRMNFNAIDIIQNSGSSRTLKFEATSFLFTQPSALVKTMTGSAAVSADTNGGTVVSEFFAAPTTTGPYLNGRVCNMNAILNDSCNINSGVNNWTGGVPTYSLSLIQTLTVNSGNNVLLSQGIQVRNSVPEPLTTSLVGAALLALAGTSMRRASKKA